MQSHPALPGATLSGQLAALRERIGELTDRGRRTKARQPDSGDLWSFLSPGSIHEWFGFSHAPGTPADQCTRSWFAPLSLLVCASARAIASMDVTDRCCILWIGRRCWPYPPLLALGPLPLLEHSFFLDPRDMNERAWATDQALRCPGVAVVVADAGGLTMAHTRRLQLSADATGTVGLLTRPMPDLSELSAAQTRWLIRPALSPCDQPRWTVELLRCKGLRPTSEGARLWTVQRSHETGDVRVVSPVPGGRAAPDAGEVRRAV